MVQHYDNDMMSYDNLKQTDDMIDVKHETKHETSTKHDLMTHEFG